MLYATYGRSIEVDPDMAGVPHRCLGPVPGKTDVMWYRGRAGALISRATLQDRKWVKVELAPETADAVILRDTGCKPPGK